MADLLQAANTSCTVVLNAFTRWTGVHFSLQRGMFNFEMWQLEMTVTNQNSIHDEIKSRLNSGMFATIHFEILYLTVLYCSVVLHGFKT